MSEITFAIARFNHQGDVVPQRALPTWEQLYELLTCHDIRSEKDGPLWSPTEYQPRLTRKKANVGTITCFVLDFDKGIAFGPFRSKWSQYAYVAHSSFSHSSDYPKWRVVFPLVRPVPAADWPPIYAKLAAAFGEGFTDRSCKDASRMYYLPSCSPENADTAFAHVNQGSLLNPDDFNAPPPPAKKKAGAAKPDAQKGSGNYATLDGKAWFDAHGCLGEDLGHGKYSVKCPWEDLHTEQKQHPEKDTDTVMWLGDGVRVWPQLCCLHDHCAEKGIEDVIELWGDADKFCSEEYRPPASSSNGKTKKKRVDLSPEAEPPPAPSPAAEEDRPPPPVDAPPARGHPYSQPATLTTEEEEDAALDIVQWPDPLDHAALHGLAGEIVCEILPHTEADEAALLFQVLAAFGNIIGHNTHFRVGASRHTANINVVLVGRSSKGRKGTSWDEINSIFEIASHTWANNHVQSGLSSGEGLIYAVRDPVEKTSPVLDKGNPTGEYRTVIVDPGIEDKRLLVLESEFASVLRVASRDGNTLSAILRQAWDSGKLRVLNKNSPIKATGAHISIVGHITRTELLKCLDNTESNNGFANRFLWAAVRRSKLLPDGGSLSDDIRLWLAEKLITAMRIGMDAGQPRRDPEATALWHERYAELSGERDGLAGVVTSRAEAQVVRLSLIYALLDGSLCIRRPHLEAALAAWKYCEASAEWIFGRGAQDPVAMAILKALRETPEGLTRTQISKQVFKGHRQAAELKRALQALADSGTAHAVETTTGGRPESRWYVL